MRKPAAAVSGLACALALLAGCSVAEPDALGTVFLPDAADPLVHFRILVKVGSADDPTGKEGLCAATWELMTSGGTRAFDSSEIVARLYPLAAAVTVTVDEEASVFAADIAVENLEAFYMVFREMLLAPRFAEEDLRLLQSNRLAERAFPGAGDNLRGLTLDVLDRLVYENYPYGRTALGTAVSLAGFTTADTKVFYGQRFLRGNIILGLAGGYPPDFADRIAADLRTMTGGYTPALRLAAPERPAIGPEILIAERRGAADDEAMGIPLDPDISEAEAEALKIAAIHLGSDRDIRLRPDRFRRQRIFFLPAVPPGEADPLVDVPAGLESLRALSRDGLPADRFELLRASLLNGARLETGGPGERLLERLIALTPPGPTGRRDRERTLLAEMTREDVGRAIRNYLDPRRLAVAVVTGDAESLRRALASALPGANVRILPPEDPAGEDPKR